VVGLIVIAELRQKDKLVICDVGQGSGAILISGSNQILIDTGPPGGAMLKCLENHLAIWDKQIETVVVSHGDNDHSGGLEEIKKYYQVEHIYYSSEIKKNDIFRIGKIEIDVVWPEKISDDSNADSIVLKVNFKDKNYWFLGDITAEVEEYLSWRNEWQDSGGVVVLAHHGSKSATTTTMLKMLRPEKVIISVGKNNQFGHPSPETLEKLTGIEVWRTDWQGEIIFD
jgi:competence protein ComEC